MRLYEAKFKEELIQMQHMHSIEIQKVIRILACF